MQKIIEHPVKPDIPVFFISKEFVNIFGKNFDYSAINYKNLFEGIGDVVEQDASTKFAS